MPRLTIPRSITRRLAALTLAAAVAAASVAAVLAAGPQDTGARPEANTDTPQERMARRYPQPVRVGALIGLPVLDHKDATFGYVRAVARTTDGRIVLVVPYRAWLGWAPTDWGRKSVAVPLETVAILGRQVAALDFLREDFAAAPPYAADGASLPPDATIGIALYRR